MAEQLVVESPQWWLERLEGMLTARRRAQAVYREYHAGQFPLAHATDPYREAFALMLKGVADNWLELVVDAVAERLAIEGFRIGDEPPNGDAWAIWQRNGLDTDSDLAHHEALVSSAAYVLVWGDGSSGKDRAEITVESSAQVVVDYYPGSRRKRAAALKLWRDDWTGDDRATIYLPSALFRYKRRENAGAAGWEQLAGAEGEIANPFKSVPMIELTNRPKLLPDAIGYGRSELLGLLSTQDQINKLLADMMVAAEFAAFRQRWASGVEIPIDPETGQPVEAFQAGIKRLWNAPDKDARFGSFEAVDLTNYVKAIENRVQSLASRSRTPPHYLLGQSGSFPSGESLKATETGLVAKARGRARRFGEGWEEVMRYAGEVENVPALKNADGAETVWADPESRTEGEHVDALLKLRTLEVPLEALWERAGFTPAQIAGFRAMLMREATLKLLAGVDPLTVQEPTPAPSPEPVPAAA